MARLRPSLTEVGVALASGAISFAYSRAGAPGAAPIAAGLFVAMGLLGALTAADRPDREGLLRASIACALGVLLGGLVGSPVRTSLLIVVFIVGRAARMVPLERRAQAERAAAAVAEERARIARDLHDVIAHSLGVVIVQVQAAERVMDGDPARAHEALQAAAAVGRDALDDMHRMVGVMRGSDAGRASQPSLADLPTLVEQSRKSGLSVDLSVTPEGGGGELSPGVELAAYRIVQEALTNAARHASGGSAVVRVARSTDGLAVEVTDGGGKARPAQGGGFGIAGMRERAALYGGTLEAGPTPQGGFTVKAWLPARRP